MKKIASKKEVIIILLGILLGILSIIIIFGLVNYIDFHYFELPQIDREISCRQWAYHKIFNVSSWDDESRIIFSELKASTFSHLPKNYIDCYAVVFTNCSLVEPILPDNFTGCYFNKYFNSSVCYPPAYSYSCKNIYSLNYVSDMNVCGYFEIASDTVMHGCKGEKNGKRN